MPQLLSLPVEWMCTWNLSKASKRYWTRKRGGKVNLSEEQVVKLLGVNVQQVTAVDIEQLKGRMDKIEGTLSHVEKAVYFAIALLISTYGGIAWFTWRLVDKMG